MCGRSLNVCLSAPNTIVSQHDKFLVDRTPDLWHGRPVPSPLSQELSWYLGNGNFYFVLVNKILTFENLGIIWFNWKNINIWKFQPSWTLFNFLQYISVFVNELSEIRKKNINSKSIHLSHTQTNVNGREIILRLKTVHILCNFLLDRTQWNIDISYIIW